MYNRKEIDNDEGVNAKTNLKTSVFDRLQSSTSHQRPAGPSVFSGFGKTPKPSFFHRLKKDELSKPSVFAEIKIGKTSSNSPPTQNKDSVFNHLGELSEIQSSISSRTKRVSTLDVKVDNSLKVNRRVLVLAGHRARASSKEGIKEQAFSNCDADHDVDDLP